MQRPSFKKVIGGIRYDIDAAAEIASDEYFDGRNMERNGTNQWLMKSPNGRWFVVHGTLWQDCMNSIEPISENEARALYEQLPEHSVEYEDAFPGAVVEAA